MRKLATVLLTLLPLGCSPQEAPRDSGPSTAPVPTTQTARDAGGMVSTAHPLATAAGVEMLEAGGNAADAALAAAFAISVVEPSMNSIGGRNQILIRLPGGEVTGIDGTTQAPATYDPETAPQANYGYPTVGVPGAVAGLFKLHEDHGTLPLSRVMEPALRYAAGGFELLPGEAARHAMAAEQIAEFEGSRAHYLKEDGSTYGAGERFVQPDLAATLTAIRDGGQAAFYEGEIARRMAQDIQAHGGAVTLESLADYRAEASLLVRGSYRGIDIVGTYVPAAGATAIQALQILENFDLSAMDEVQWAAVVSQALGLAMGGGYREAVENDPEMAAAMTSKERAAELAAQVEVPEAGAVPAAGAPDAESPGVVSPHGGSREEVRPLRIATAPADWLQRSTHTTHLSTADESGMMVALTQTIGPNMGSKVATPGLGFLYAATLGGYLGDLQPGERARSAISPLILTRDGEPFLVLGAAGGGMIPQAVVQVILRMVDQGLPLDEALAAPRVASRAPGALQMETTPGDGWGAAVVEALAGLGYDVTTQDRPGAFGRVHAVFWDAGSGAWIGGADPDWEGAADGPEEE